MIRDGGFVRISSEVHVFSDSDIQTNNDEKPTAEILQPTAKGKTTKGSGQGNQAIIRQGQDNRIAEPYACRHFKASQFAALKAGLDQCNHDRSYHYC